MFVEIENDLKINKSIVEMVSLIPNYTEDPPVYEVFITLQGEKGFRKKCFSIESEARAYYNLF